MMAHAQKEDTNGVNPNFVNLAAPSRLCSACRELPFSLFEEDEYASLGLHHLSINDVVVAASQGCYGEHRKHDLLSTSDCLENTELKYRSRSPPQTWQPDFPPATSTTPINYVELSRIWLDDCVNSHVACGAHQDSFRPTRLLDLQIASYSPDLALVELVDSSSESEGPVAYAALSHCWGPPGKHPPTTTSSNLRNRKSVIAFDELSTTFRDAVDIARNLQIRYLWIDSLCILQDDPIDWEKESAVMGEIYGGARVTLSALSASDSTQGCRINANGRYQSLSCRYIYLPYGIDSYQPGRSVRTVRIFTSNDLPQSWSEEYEVNPLRRRGWTLQERLLSRRSIHFSCDQLLWECGTAQIVSDEPWRRVSEHSSELIGPHASYDAVRWYDIVEEFSCRSLTKPQDRFPALSGIASKLTPLHGRYAAGLWLRDIHVGLLWSAYDQLYSRKRNVPSLVPSRSPTYRAPSWSWASLDGYVNYSWMRQRRGAGGVQSTNHYLDHIAIEVLGTDIELVGKDRNGRVVSGALRIKGRLSKAFKVVLRRGDGECVYMPGKDFRWRPRPAIKRAVVRTEAGGRAVGAAVLFLDTEDEVDEQMAVHLLPICSSHPLEHRFGTNPPKPPNSGPYGLGLVKVSNESNTYRRIGLAMDIDMHCDIFDDVTCCDITII